MYATGLPYDRKTGGISSNVPVETQRYYNLCLLQTVNAAIFTLGRSEEVTLRLLTQVH